MVTLDTALPGPVPPSGVVSPRLDEALLACVALGAFGPQSTVEQFIALGLERLGRLLDASGGHFVVASKRRPPEGDPLFGWRIDVYYGVGATFDSGLVRVDELLRGETYVHDPGVQRTTRDAGRHRIYHDPDPRTQPTRAGSIDAQFWEAYGLVDRLKLVYTLSPKLELHFAFDRAHGGLPYEPRDIATLETLIAGIETWGRRVAFLHGCLEGQTLLSPRERTLLCALLGQEPLKNIAGALGISEARAREVTRSVYRKLNVDGRIGLSCVWAGEPAAEASMPISGPLLGRRRA